MKKIVGILFVCIVILLSFIYNVNRKGKDFEIEKMTQEENYSGLLMNENNFTEGEESDMFESDTRTKIARALHKRQDDRSLKFLLNCINTIEAGNIQSAKSKKVDGQKVLDIVAENGTNYRIYLNANGTADAIENLDNGEWPITSDR